MIGLLTYTRNMRGTRYYDDHYKEFPFFVKYDGKHTETIPPLEHLYVKGMGNQWFKDYSGVGEKLTQLAIERSMKLGVKGRVAFNSSYGSGLYHYRQGFRPTNEHSLETLMDADKAKERTIAIPCMDMFLPEEGIAKWKKIIEENPILGTLD